jgi:hypothetical protein
MSGSVYICEVMETRNNNLNERLITPICARCM